MYTRMNIDFSFQLSPLNEELRSVNDSVYSRLVAPSTSTVLWLRKITYRYYIVHSTYRFGLLPRSGSGGKIKDPDLRSSNIIGSSDTGTDPSHCRVKSKKCKGSIKKVRYSGAVKLQKTEINYFIFLVF